jgi:hypothetical protein
MFIFEFDKSSGSSVVYAGNGSVVAYYHFMTLEYYNEKVKDWRQCGTFKSLIWLKHDDYHYSVVEYFEDSSTSPKTSYTITYDFRSDSRVKITIRVESGATRQYRLHWSLDGVVYSDWCEKVNLDGVKHQLLFGGEDRFIGLDWQDVYEQFHSDIASYTVGTSAKGRKADIYFVLGAVEAGGVLTVDPSVVGQSTSDYAIAYPYQRKCFYANGRYWVFYSDGANLVYKTSTDGVSWTAAATIRSCSTGQHFSVWFDGTYMHYVVGGGTSYYRRGLPNSNGTVTWSASEQTLPVSTYSPCIAVDSNGYVWVAYMSGNYPWVTRSGNNDGTWGTTPSGFPYKLSTTSSAAWQVAVVPLTGGKVLVLYISGSGYAVTARRWDGSSWGTAVSTTYAVKYYYAFSAVAAGDDVHLVYTKYSSTSPTDLIYQKYVYASNSFTSAVAVDSISTDSCPVISRNPSNDDLYVFWAGYPTANHIYYKKYSGGSWGSRVDWIDESATGMTNSFLTCFYNVYTNRIGVMYMTKTSSPYNVKFAFIKTVNSVPNAPTLQNPSANARFNPSAAVTFSWVFSDPDPEDTQGAYRLQIGDSGFTTIYLDTGKVSSPSSSTTQTLPSAVGIYYWRVKTWDDYDAEGPWSSAGAIIVDRILLTNLSASKTRLPVGSSVEIRATAVLEYDGHPLAAEDTLIIGGLTLQWDPADGRFEGSELKSSVAAKTYNTMSGYEATYGITAVNMNGLSVTVIWDRLKISAVTEYVGGSVRPPPYYVQSEEEVGYMASCIYEYDSTPATALVQLLSGGMVLDESYTNGSGVAYVSSNAPASGGFSWTVKATDLLYDLGTAEYACPAWTVNRLVVSEFSAYGLPNVQIAWTTGIGEGVLNRYRSMLFLADNNTDVPLNLTIGYTYDNIKLEWLYVNRSSVWYGEPVEARLKIVNMRTSTVYNLTATVRVSTYYIPYFIDLWSFTASEIPPSQATVLTGNFSFGNLPASNRPPSRAYPLRFDVAVAECGNRWTTLTNQTLPLILDPALTLGVRAWYLPGEQSSGKVGFQWTITNISETQLWVIRIVDVNWLTVYPPWSRQVGYIPTTLVEAVLKLNRYVFETDETAIADLTVKNLKVESLQVMIVFDYGWKMEQTGSLTIPAGGDIVVSRIFQAPYAPLEQYRTYSFTANIYDKYGSLLLAQTVRYDVFNQPPLIELLSPEQGSVLNGTVTIDLKVWDSGSGVSKVEYRWSTMDSWLTLEQPYDITFDSRTVPNGRIMLYVRATDNAGFTRDEAFYFYVSNPEVESAWVAYWKGIGDLLSKYIFVPGIVTAALVMLIGYLLGRWLTKKPPQPIVIYANRPEKKGGRGGGRK